MISIGTFDCKSDTNKISLNMSEPLILDGGKKYMLSLLNWRYKNVFENMTPVTPNKIRWNVTSNGNLTALSYDFPEGIYEIDEILNILNSYTKMTRYEVGALDDEYFARFELDLIIGKIKIVPDLTVINNYNIICDFDNILPSSILNSSFINLGLTTSQYFKYDEPSTLVTIYGTKEPSVSSYNSFYLLSGIVTSKSYVTDPNNPGMLIPINMLYSVSSAVEAFDLAEYSSLELLNYEIQSGLRKITKIEFEMVADDFSTLYIVPGSKLELQVTFQITEVM